MVARVDNGMICPEGRSRRGQPMSVTPDSPLANPEQLIANLQRQLAEFKAERDQALEQQTAMGEVLQVINSSPGDLAPVFDAMLDSAMRLCDASYGHLRIFDGESLVPVAIRGASELVEQLEPRSASAASPSGRIIAGERIVHILDLKEVYLQGHEELQALVETGGARTVLTVALRKEDTLLGSLTLYRREVRLFSERQIALVENFASQAVIAMENARLLTETRAALEQQTATAEVLQVINSSPGDLAPVFDAMLEKAMRLCEASFGYLLTYDGEGFLPVADRGHPDFSAWVREQGRIVPEPGTINARIVDGEAVVQVADVASDPFYRGDTAMGRAIIEIGRFRTVLTVALRKDGALRGVIHIYRQEVRPFTDRQIALLQNFAAQAVIGMENARLLTETCEALDQQTATGEVLRVINSSPGELAPVFQAILEKATALCDAASGLLSVLDGDRFRRAAAHRVPAAYAEFFRATDTPVDDSATPPARIIAGERAVHIVDMAAEEAYRAGEPNWRALVDLAGARAALSVPLLKDEAVRGLITILRREVRPFTDKQIALLQNFAAQAVIAVENARLLGELRHRTEEVAELNRGLESRVAEQVDELGRVGRLKRFLAPQLAELIVSQGDEKILESHRREIVVVFCDLRGYTAFTETAEPEEVLDFLREYHGALGPLVAQFEGTLDQFSGDGIMVFFNDPVAIPDPAERAVKMAVAMREAAGQLIAAWRERGRDLGFGAGIAQGYATLGQIGFSERSGYTAIGTVCNVAARLCAEAKDGQILLSQRVNVALKGGVATEQVGALALKGLAQPVVAYNVPLVGNQAAFRVIEGGAPSA
jgi:class 3 adenylate cyclase